METLINQNNPNAYRHTHNGVDSPLLETSSIAGALNAPQSALTAADNGSLSSADATIIANMRTRINELETKLQAMGLLS